MEAYIILEADEDGALDVEFSGDIDVAGGVLHGSGLGDGVGGGGGLGGGGLGGRGHGVGSLALARKGGCGGGRVFGGLEVIALDDGCDGVEGGIGKGLGGVTGRADIIRWFGSKVQGGTSRDSGQYR